MSEPPDDRDARAKGLVFAICHEIGNLLAAIRLNAHLIDDDASAKELAVTSVELDELCARASPLLSQVRPLLARSIETSSRLDARVLLLNLQRVLSDQGLRGISLEIEIAPDLPASRADAQVVHPLLLSLVHGALEAARPSGWVRLRARPAAGGFQVEIETSGSDDDELEDWRRQSLRGRVLACSTADHILQKLGGELSVVREHDSFRVIVRLPPDSN